jgi:hypothetical protein
MIQKSDNSDKQPKTKDQKTKQILDDLEQEGFLLPQIVNLNIELGLPDVDLGEDLFD